MKNRLALILIGTFALTAFSAFAETTGLPSEDTVVRLVRERFRAAKDTVPLEVLKNGGLHCRSYVAVKGDFRRANVVFTADEQFDGLWEGTEKSDLASPVALTFTRSPNQTLFAIANTFHRENGKETTLLSREDAENIYFEEVQTFKKKWNDSTHRYECSVDDAANAVGTDDECAFVPAYFVCPKAK